MNSLKKQNGFTLIEIMIVIAIVGMLAAIAIPNLLRARVNSNEGAMKTAMKTFSSANESYRSVQASSTYASGISDLTTALPPYLDPTWTSPTKHSFNIAYSPASAPIQNYSFLATPAAGSGIQNSYCVDQTGAVIFGNAGVVGATSGCSGGDPLAVG